MFSYCRHRHSSPDPRSPALEIRGLKVFYPNEEKPALGDVSMRVPVGASMALVGANGAGKSTLFKAISGLLPVRAGTVRIFGHRLGACHHRVVYLPQRSEIDWHFPMSVLDLTMTGRYVYLGWFARAGKKDFNIALDALEQLGVADLKDRQISKLSGGQQQRALIARALSQNADLLLLDEPLNAVDAETRHTIARVLDAIKEQGKTVIMATHYFDEKDKRYDGAIYLKDGQQVTDTKSRQGHEGCDHA